MLKLVILGAEYFDDDIEEFVYPENKVIELEHSLVSLSKWESKFNKPFLSREKKTPEQIIEYIKNMMIDPETPLEWLDDLTQENVDEITQYINAPMTATWFNENAVQQRGGSGEAITAELIYYWMTAFQISYHPAETWHLNRLFTLIKVCNMKNQKPKKMGKSDMLAQRRRMNAQRKAEMGTSG